MNVYLTGIGSISAIGANVRETHDALVKGQHGLKWSDTHALILGSISKTNHEFMSSLAIHDTSFSRTSLLGIVAAKEAWGENEHRADIRTGFISSTSVGELDITEGICFDHYNANRPLDVKLLTQEAGASTEKIASFLNFNGYVNTISTACSSGANAILLGARLLKTGRLDRVLVGGVDPFDLHNINGFSSLNICDQELCRPFDKNRNGLNLGEGAAFVLLENDRSLSKTHNKVHCIVSGWSNTADAYHQTASSPNGIGAALAMEQALNLAGLQPEDIDYINAHGTGTINNDLSESRAIESVFKESNPVFSSTKGYTGHTLAAAGAIEAVISVLALTHSFIPPSLRFKDQIEEVSIKPVDQLQHVSLQHIMSNSFGFGGNCSTLIFSKH